MHLFSTPAPLRILSSTKKTEHWKSRYLREELVIPQSTGQRTPICKMGHSMNSFWADGSTSKFSGINVDKQRLLPIDPKHPICNGWSEYELHDEFYLRMKLSDKADPLLKVTTQGREEIVAWTLEREGKIKDRSFGITLGRFHPNYGIKAFRRSIVNGILETSGFNIPKAGSMVDINQENDLQLPPDPRKKK